MRVCNIEDDQQVKYTANTLDNNWVLQLTPDHPPQLYHCPNYYQLLVQVIEKSVHLSATPKFDLLILVVDYSRPIAIGNDVKTSG